ncbi:YD repeat-containing protein [Chryseobacterium wanjuense]|jgi:YD repeat-containing protein|uniref:YD repeat-containing protein n=1 Tax=Chryseobacterium wanjuense TaxID=356305 RepID=A0A1I0NQA0_9FLAO|nr:RHS repeat protein [Chryseobacterium wanjuense]SEW03419.1 YD repeat-containing protein [Chryseobacterium wanjuense]
MKNVINILITIVFISFNLKAQTIITPEPTSSSLQNYVNASVSPAMGIPSINIPLYQLETSDANLPLSLSLSYHPYNAKAIVPASEVGAGWSLFKGSMISKETYSKNNEYTEINDLTKLNADRFYYSIPGHSGKFIIYKDPLSGYLKLQNLTGEKIKIDFTRDESSTKLIINSFKITDDKGYQYLFDNYNISSWSQPGIPYGVKTQRSSYVITSVKKADNTDIIIYSYDIKTRYIDNTPNIPKYKLCKLNTITTSKGKIKFEYDYDLYLDNTNNYNNDFYTINNISLVSNSGKMISKYKFIKGNIPGLVTTYSFDTPIATLGSKLGLYRLQKLDSNNVLEEQTEFFYNETGSDTQYGYSENPDLYGDDICSNENPYMSPKKEVIGLLQKIIFPTGGSVVYDFEASEVYTDRTTEDYTTSNIFSEPLFQYYDISDSLDFDTNISRTYTFNVSGASNKTYPVKIGKGLDGLDYGLTTTHGDPYPFSFSVLNSNNVTMQVENSPCNNIFTKMYKLPPGTYTIKINLWGGTGNFAIIQLKSLPKPYKNYDPLQIGARIKRITYFDHDDNIQKEKVYEYNLFTDPLTSSGYQFADENTSLAADLDGFVLYRNVREKEISGNQSNGYIDYYFDTPEDYKDLSGNIIYYYYNLTSQGILKKKNTYNSQNQLIETSEYDYTFEEVPGAESQNMGYFTSVPSWIQYIKDTSISYLGQSFNKTMKETTFSPNNFQEILSKITTNNGDINEVSTKYAQDLSDSHLITANMISVPLQVETKSNGITLSKATTVYGNSSHFYPTALESTDLDQISETQITYDLYDNKGNLVQTTDKSGNSVTTIWGYYQTLPIAQIVGVKYNDISSLSVVTAAISASNSDADNPANEGALLTALQNLRLASQLQGYSMTVNTYDPLVGITNTISSNGIKKSYEYDAAGRLLKVKNSDGQVLKENQYNYKH